MTPTPHDRRMDATPNLRRELDMMAELLLRTQPDADVTRGERGLVYAHGIGWKGATVDVELVGGYGRPRECFKNATEATLAYGLTYCEGLAMNDRVPFAIHHGWNVTADGRVCDPTWQPDVGGDPAQWEYVGIAFDTDWLLSRIAETGEYGILSQREVWRGEPLPAEAFSDDWYDHQDGVVTYADFIERRRR